MRTRLFGVAAAVAMAAGIAGTTAAPANASGWSTVSTSTVGKSLSYSSWTTLGRSFKPVPGATYRYCVVGKGTTKANLQPTAFGTVASFTNSSKYVTRCTKSWRTPTGYGSTMYPTASKLTKTGSVYISKVYVQRYYSGPIPV